MNYGDDKFTLESPDATSTISLDYSSKRKFKTNCKDVKILKSFAIF
jgi:hypothetical protein